MMNRYLAHFLIAVPLLMGVIAGFNWWVDPYAIYREHSTPPNNPQTLLIMNERVFKTVALAKTRADIVLLGTSVTDLGVGREHPAFAGKRVLNMATFGQPIAESRLLMERVLSHDKPPIIVLGLDLLAFNELLAKPSDFVMENYSVERPFVLLLSISTLVDSWKAVRHPAPVARQCCDADGFRAAQNTAGDARTQFIANERAYLREKYLPYPECRFSLTGKKGESSMNELRAMIALAHKHHVDFRLFISPSHARQWETIAVAGMSNIWEEWKRELVSINENEAHLNDASPFSLWDFSGYDVLSSEALPAQNDTSRLMHWYSDSAHYLPALGKLVVQRMFTATEDNLPHAWGQRLEAGNIEMHLTQLRLAQQSYRESHAQDIAEIQASVQAVNALKQCPNLRQ